MAISPNLRTTPSREGDVEMYMMPFNGYIQLVSIPMADLQGDIVHDTLHDCLLSSAYKPARPENCKLCDVVRAQQLAY
jgi:hypothetical protein